MIVGCLESTYISSGYSMINILPFARKNVFTSHKKLHSRVIHGQLEGEADEKAYGIAVAHIQLGSMQSSQSSITMVRVRY